MINGKSFDPARSDAFPDRLDRHLGAPQQDLGRPRDAPPPHLLVPALPRRQPPPPWEDCLKDTFFIHPGERILVAGHLVDYPGKFVVHCHMLDHEDHGLMSQFRVREG